MYFKHLNGMTKVTAYFEILFTTPSLINIYLGIWISINVCHFLPQLSEKWKWRKCVNTYYIGITCAKAYPSLQSRRSQIKLEKSMKCWLWYQSAIFIFIFYLIGTTQNKDTRKNDVKTNLQNAFWYANLTTRPINRVEHDLQRRR